MKYVPVPPVDLSTLEKSLSDGVAKVFTVEKIWPFNKTPAFQIAFGSRACLPGAQGI